MNDLYTHTEADEIAEAIWAARKQLDQPIRNRNEALFAAAEQMAGQSRQQIDNVAEALYRISRP